jgi:SNF2 family DNA or RNA helicase
MTPYEIASTHWLLPKEIHGNPLVVKPQQIAAVDALASDTDWRTGNYLDVGCGKTLVSTLIASYRFKVLGVETWVVTMPPVLVPQWGAWLAQVTRADGSPLRVTMYRGTPTQRRALELKVDVVLVGIQIFKKDFLRFCTDLDNRVVAISVDEAHSLCNPASQNFKRVHEFSSVGIPVDLITGTPANNPEDAFALCQFTNPGAYRSQPHFESLHVAERDFMGKATEFTNLGLLHKNLMVNAYRILFEDMYPGTEAPLYDQVSYDLDDKHLRLYDELVENRLLELKDGTVLDATAMSKLFHALGQIVLNWDHFSQDEKNVAQGYDLLNEKLSQLMGKKLVVFAEYKLTMRAIVSRLAARKIKAVTINGDTSEAQKIRNIAEFINNPDCPVILIHRRSGGAGLDGLQHVCHHMLFLEPIRSPRDFSQCVARLKRTGQKNRVVVWIATATGTLQVAAVEVLLHNDRILNQVVRNVDDLRNLLRGRLNTRKP